MALSRVDAKEDLEATGSLEEMLRMNDDADKGPFHPALPEARPLPVGMHTCQSGSLGGRFFPLLRKAVDSPCQIIYNSLICRGEYHGKSPWIGEDGSTR